MKYKSTNQQSYKNERINCENKANKSKRIAKNCTINACFLLIVIVMCILLQKNNLTINKNLQIGLENNTNEVIYNTEYCEDAKNNFNNEQILESNLVSDEEAYSEDSEIQVCMEKAIDENSIKELSKEEAYSLQDYGMFLPKTILKGYEFRSAYIYNIHSSREVLSVGYEAGYSYVDINVSLLSSDDENRRVKVSEREKYDITKYTIPFAESIPENLYYTMHYPIFQGKEVTEEILQLRKVKRSEQGEDGGVTESIRFAIQCGEYIVEYNIKGKSLDSVYDMVISSDFFEVNR